MNKLKIVVTKGKLWWHYVIVASNGQVLSTSETYFSRSNCLRAARKLADALKMKVEIR